MGTACVRLDVPFRHVQPYAKGIRNKWYELEPFLLFFLVEGGDRTLQHHEDQDHQADHDGGPFGRHAEVGGQRVEVERTRAPMTEPST